MFTRQTMNNRLSLRPVLQCSLVEIEKSLNVKVIGLKRMTKIYGSKANSFLVKTVSAKNKMVTYFLKFNKKEHIKRELDGIRLIKKFLPTPKVILISKKCSHLIGYYLNILKVN